jgi:hypothetical protein
MATAGVGLAKPNNLATQGVSAGLQREGWSDIVYLESLQQEPLLDNANLREEIEPGDTPKKLPTNKIVLQVTPSGKDWKALRKVTNQFLKALQGAGRYGNQETLLGNEEQMQLLYSSFFSNDWAHAVSAEAYGIDFRELSATQIYEKIGTLLAQWLGEKRGEFYRQAILETRSSNLTYSPLSLTQPLNPNWFLPGALDADQPAYSATAATLENNVGAALAGVTATDNVLNVRRILRLGDYLQERYIKPLTIDGMQLYILMVHPDEHRYLIDPSRSDSFAKYYIDAAALPNVKNVIPGTTGVIGNKVCVVPDWRCPTVKLSGTSADYTISTGYLAPGRQDGRTTGRVANVDFNANYVLGEHALGYYESEMPHFENQYDEYKKYYGKGYIGAFGVQLINWDKDTPTDSTIQSEGTFIVPTQR